MLTKNTKSNHCQLTLAGFTAFLLILSTTYGSNPAYAEHTEAHKAKARTADSTVASPESNHQIAASTLIGTDVKNQKNEVVGEVKDIIILNDSGDVPYVVVDFAGALDFSGDEIFAIPFEALKHEHEDGVCVLNVDMVKELPGDKEKADWMEVEEKDSDTAPDGQVIGDYWVEPTGDKNAKGEHRSKALSAQAIIGSEIHNKAGEEVGELHELLVDLDSRAIAYTVFAAGGVLGIGDEHYLMPWKSLTHSREEGKLIANVDKAMLEGMPRYEGEDEAASPPPAPGS